MSVIPTVASLAELKRTMPILIRPSVVLRLNRSTMSLAAVFSSTNSPDYSFQEIQSAFKEVTPDQATPNTPTTFTYTMTIKNQGTGTITLERIIDFLPPLFQYSNGKTTGTITSDDPDISVDEGDLHCGDKPDQLTWVFSPGINIAP